MPGASGATVEVGLKTTRKTGPPGPVLTRLHEQYVWLREHSDVSRVVRVKRRLSDGYEMETLHECPSERSTAFMVADAAESIWKMGPEVRGDIFTHARYVWERLERLPETTSKLALELFRGVMKHWDDLHRCLTHGDMTRLNVMLSDKDWMTFIDPIPATDALPDIWAVDMGKLLVSALGYDELFLGLPHDPDQETPIHDVLHQMTYLELDATKYLAAVHVARMLPYHPKEVHDALIDIADRAVGL